MVGCYEIKMLLDFTEWIRRVLQRQLEKIIGTIKFSFFLSFFRSLSFFLSFILNFFLSFIHSFFLSLIFVSLLTVCVEGFGYTWSYSAEPLWNRDRPVVLLPVGMLIAKCRCCITDRSICTFGLLCNDRIVRGTYCNLAGVFAAVRLLWFMGTESRQNFISKYCSHISYAYYVSFLVGWTMVTESGMRNGKLNII